MKNWLYMDDSYLKNWDTTISTVKDDKFLTLEKEPEWLELYNSGQNTIALKGWGIDDDRDTSLVDTFVFIYPGQYKILTSESGLDSFYGIEDSLIILLRDLPSFNNTEDNITLVNPLQILREQVPYALDWLEGEEWRIPSLERINIELDFIKQGNWGPSTSAKGATPGERNTLFTALDGELKSKLVIEPKGNSCVLTGQNTIRHPIHVQRRVLGDAFSRHHDVHRFPCSLRTNSDTSAD